MDEKKNQINLIYKKNKNKTHRGNKSCNNIHKEAKKI